ncbi:amino acid adenylation domain-containing protein, partial [Chitinophagaceae bacterium LB-8]
MQKTPFPLHPAQNDICVDQLININSPHYNIGLYIKLKGPLHKGKFIDAVNSSPKVFDAFKMRFDVAGADPHCYFDQEYEKLELAEMDFSDRENAGEEARCWMQNRFSIPFKIQQDSLLFEHVLIKIASDEYWLFFRYHHLIIDGYGFIVWINYIAKKYRSLIDGDNIQFEYPAYSDEILNASKYFNSAEFELDGNYWKEWITQKPQKILQKKNGYETDYGKKSATFHFDLDDQQKKFLEDLQLTAHASLQQLTIAALIIYFGKTSNQSEFVFGTPVHKRGSKRLRNIVGTFTGILPFKCAYQKEDKLSDLLLNITNTQRRDYRHQNYLIGDLSRHLKINSSEEYLCEIFINYQPLNLELFFGDGLQATILRIVNEFERNPLQICWMDYGNKQPMQLQLYSLNEYFSENELKFLAQRIIYILEQFPDNFHRNIECIDVLPFYEQQLISGFNDTEVDYPKDKTVIDLFEQQVKKTPHNIAVVFEEQQLTYQELNERANHLAQYLRGKGVIEETLVPLCIDRSMNLLVGILGILKAGAAYVPIDPDYPLERIQFMLQDTEAFLVIGSQNTKAKFLDVEQEFICLDELRDMIDQLPITNLQRNLQPSHLAYVIYTSGSTGRPKGVLIEHRSVLSLIVNQTKEFGIHADENILQFSNYAFDASVEQTFLALCNGAKLVLVPKELLARTEGLIELMLKEKVTHLHATPSYLLTIRAGKHGALKRVIAGGESCPVHLANAWTPYVQFYNEYGPTETTVTSVEYLCPQAMGQQTTVLIGKPIGNTKVYILNEDQDMVPIGSTGEICIGGAGLARGYLNREELTHEKFIANPFKEGERLYCTGDMGRWLVDGSIEYLGRRDEQVKIRGYRIELGEIETVVLQSGMMNQCVVAAKEDSSGNKRLVGYVVADDSFNTEQLLEYLKSRLPEYMVPLQWMKLDNIQLNHNGKIDRKALPNVEVTNISVYVAPCTDLEEQLVQIWQQLLKVEPIGIHDNFFEVGGHSLLAMQIIAAIRKQRQIELLVKDILDYPTIALLARHLMAGSRELLLPSIKVVEPRPELLPLSFAQERLWFIDQLEGSVHYHIPTVFRWKGTLNKEALESAFRDFISRHEILRTVIKEEDGHSYQSVQEVSKWKLVCVDGSKYREDAEALRACIQQQIHTSFDLSGDYMLRAQLIQLDVQEHVLVIVLHHIASDGWSTSILVRELVELYGAYSQGHAPQLNPLPIQYADYALWQRDYLQGEVLEHKLTYWKEKLTGAETLQLPTDYRRPTVQSTHGTFVNFSIDQTVSNKLKKFSQQQGVTLFMTLLAAYKVLLYRYSGQQDICVGTPIAGRQQQEVEGLIGFFVNTLALRDELRSELSFTELLQQVKQTTLEAYEHQEVPFEKVVDAVVKERDLSRSPLFQVMLVLQNTPEVPHRQLKELVLEEEQVNYDTAKFEMLIDIKETGFGLQGSVNYLTDLFTSETIERLVAHFKALLHSIVQQPQQSIGSLNMLSMQEEAQLLHGFNASEVDYPKENIVSLFEQQVLQTPNNIAVIFEEEQLT